VDQYRIAVRADAPPGRYQIEVGLYDAATGLRLAAVDSADQILLGDRVLLEEVVEIGEGR
jgi:hypothetical protein